MNYLKKNLFLMDKDHANFVILASILIGISLIFTMSHFLIPTLVGDGSEYYAMYIAWKHTLRPYMTAESWSFVDMLSKSGSISGFLSLEFLDEIFPVRLELGDTTDFNHFWFYSALTAMLSALFSLVGIKLSPHAAFIVTHWALYCLTVILAYRYFRWQGLLSVLALTFISPMFWYIDKVHVEFFTFCLTLSSVIVFLKRKYMLSALFLAIASTQNISFAVVALVPFCIHFFDTSRKTNTPMNVFYASLTSIFVLLHPLYYFSRLGVITPQLLHPTVELGVYSRIFYIWLLDPDLGLLPNWPLGFLIISGGACALLRKKWPSTREDYYLILFVFVYLLVSLYAQSSTKHINSGATPGVSRYALWYIPLFFPFAIHLLNSIKNVFWAKLTIALLCVIAIAYTLIFQGPHLYAHTAPTPASQFIQRYLPRLYNPPPVLFVARYSSQDIHKVRAIIGPDCRKILVFPDARRSIIGGNSLCNIATDKLESVLTNRLNQIPHPNNPIYIRLTKQEVIQVRYSCLDKADFSKNTFIPISGFSFPESHGRWTDSNQASFTCYIPPDTKIKPTKVRIHAAGFAYGEHIQHVMITINNSNPVEYLFSDSSKREVVELVLPDDATNPITIDFLLLDAISPYELGFNDDRRKIAITISAIEFL